MRAPEESFHPIDEQFMTNPDSPNIRSIDLDMPEDNSDPTDGPDSGVHVTLGDSASNPLSTFPQSDDETTKELQAAEDTQQAQDPEMD